MSSMDRSSLLAIIALSALSVAAIPPACAQDSGDLDRARAGLVASSPTQTSQAIQRWEYLKDTRNLRFRDYASFVLANPGFPQEERLRIRAENAMADEALGADEILAYFREMPPVTNPGKARYAIALAGVHGPQSPDAIRFAREAWRGGEMNGSSEAYVESLFASQFTPDDHDARMDSLLWQEDIFAATRQLLKTSPARREEFTARLALINGSTPAAAGVNTPPNAQSDAGYAYNLARYYRKKRQIGSAVNILANRPTSVRPARDPEAFVGEALRAAKNGGSVRATQIAQRVDDLFEPGADVSKMSYRLRDDYTSLMWLGGTKALWDRHDGRTAAPLFYRYGAAARTPQTRSKGFYWAGLASQRAGDASSADRYYRMAAAYPDRFYGQLALEKLGQAIPPLGDKNATVPTAEQRAAFNREPLTRAVVHVARGAPWRTGIQFYRTIAQQADTEAEHMLTTELAREIGRRDLAVNVTEAAGADGFNQFVAQGFPVLQTPPGVNWTMVHAITRQESQFAENAISHAGARGLMQLMPGTAREEAQKQGRSYLRSSLINSPTYNMQLGNGYFARMMDRYGGSYPLAIAAYNAGPGNVNKWLRSNGDPRKGSIDWVTWIERIPIYETKNYVQRVIENAATYEQLYPQNARFGRPRSAGEFLR